jgi:DNA repair protein RadC
MAGHKEQRGLTSQGSTPERRRSLIGPRVYVELVRDPGPAEPVVLSRSADIYAFLKDHIANADRERFLTILLNQKHVVIGVEEVSVGSLTQAIVHPREVFKSIILSSAAAFVVAHNHPSGDPTPSQEDIAITRRLREVADLLGIRLLDHIVIGSSSYISFVEGGYW